MFKCSNEQNTHSDPALRGGRFRSSVIRISSLTICLWLILASTTTAAQSTTQPAEPKAGSLLFVPTDKDLLATSVAATTLQNTSLKDAIKTLATLTGKNLVLGIRGLEAANIDLNAPHQFTLPAGALQTALQTILQTAAPQAHIVIIADDGVVQIMSQAQADNIITSKSYYLEDLIANMPQILKNASPPHKTAPTPTLPPTYADVIGYRIPNRPAALMAAPVPTRYSSNIIELITSNIRPEVWKANGGKTAEIVVINNRVNVLAPVAVHTLLDSPKIYNPNALPRYINYSPGTGSATVQPPR